MAYRTTFGESGNGTTHFGVYCDDEYIGSAFTVNGVSWKIRGFFRDVPTVFGNSQTAIEQLCFLHQQTTERLSGKVAVPF